MAKWEKNYGEQVGCGYMWTESTTTSYPLG